VPIAEKLRSRHLRDTFTAPADRVNTPLFPATLSATVFSHTRQRRFSLCQEGRLRKDCKPQPFTQNRSHSLNQQATFSVRGTALLKTAPRASLCQAGRGCGHRRPHRSPAVKRAAVLRGRGRGRRRGVYTVGRCSAARAVFTMARLSSSAPCIQIRSSAVTPTARPAFGPLAATSASLSSSSKS
jgi:hypothetical protein